MAIMLDEADLAVLNDSMTLSDGPELTEAHIRALDVLAERVKENPEYLKVTNLDDPDAEVLVVDAACCVLLMVHAADVTGIAGQMRAAVELDQLRRREFARNLSLSELLRIREMALEKLLSRNREGEQ